MKIILLLVALLTVTGIQVQASSFEDIRRKLQKEMVDENQLNELLKKNATAWDTFTLQEKQTAARGTIISMGMETSENPEIFQQHTQAVIRCMDTGGHRLNLHHPHFSVQNLIAVGECTAKTYKQYCTICKP